MAHRILLAMLILFLTAGTAASEPFKILIIGDSIAAGVVGWPQGPPYTTFLLDYLSLDIDLKNMAWSGTTSKDWAPWTNFYRYLARPRLPTDLVIFTLGGNDASALGGHVPHTPEDYRASMMLLIENLQRDGARKILWIISPKFGIDNCTYYGVNNTITNQFLAEYREVALDICSNNPLVGCGPDLYSSFPASYFGAFCDPHPNRYGSVFIAQQLVEPIQKVYRELNPIEVELGPQTRRIVAPRNPRAFERSLRRLTPVSILSTEEFDAPGEVIEDSITFGVTGDEQSLWGCVARDTNRDGLQDLLCLFHMGQFGFLGPENYTLVLKADTYQDWPIRGEGEWDLRFFKPRADRRRHWEYDPSRWSE